MMRHIEDRGELGLAIDDEGSILLVCQACLKEWVLTGAKLQDADVAQVRALKKALQLTPDLFQGLGIASSKALGDQPRTGIIHKY